MIKPPHAAVPHGRAAVRALGSALLAAAAVLGGCGSKEAAGPTQVVAKVSGEEITELQVNQALERQPGLKPDQLEPVSRKLVSGLVEQEIVLQKARDLKIDRDQRVVQNVEALKREVIARAYLDRIAEGAAKPSPTELQAYFDANPMLFKQRRIYTFQELSAKVSDAQKAGIEAQLTTLKSPAELEAYLKAQQIPTRSERTTAAAENVPLQVLQRVATLKAGQPSDHAACDAVLVLHRRLMPHLDVFAPLMRRHHRLEDLLDRDDVGKARLRHRPVARDGAGAQHHHGDAADGHSLDH